jgi:peptidyl-dipeptidase Dcp
MTENPFFETWTTPFGVPPFDRIRPEHFPDALDEGMRRHREEIDAITANAAPPDFANTIAAMELAGRLLRCVHSVFSNLVVSLGGEALQAVERDYAPKLASHYTAISLDPGLFRRVQELHDRRATLALEPDQARLLERSHLGFIRGGAALGAAEKQRMAEISSRLATLHTAFGQNVLHDENSWQLELGPQDLDGLPDFVIEGAKRAATERGVAGGMVITLSRSLIEPFLTFSTRRDLRQVAHAAWVARGENPGAHDNRVLIPEILALRAERAKLLGYAHFADFRLADTMAGTPQAVAQLTGEVWDAGRARALQEQARLQQMAETEGLNEPLQAWDWLYYAEKVRRADFAIDEAEVKPYFVLENIQRAVFDTAGRLFGLSFVPRPDVPVYHPDVRAYEVRAGERHIGVFLADNFARTGKRSGAWMSSYREQENMGEEIRPIIVNNNNFAPSTPALLSFDDARTMFHEFGHALHGLLSDVRYPSQSGTAVRRDFVELPSQIYEHWLEIPETLREYARHHETGEPIPAALVEKLLAARTFNQGFATVEYTASAILDMQLHAHPAPETLDVAVFERDALAALGMPAAIGARHRPPHFQHLFAGGGYAAGYYSYLWAEVLDADGFALFEATGDAFDPALAARFKTLLSSGDTRDPMELYIDFAGRAPDTKPLLVNRGLVSQ